MTVFVAFLRAVNVGGTTSLPMKVLAALCTDLGLQDVRTYIQSGNVVFASKLTERKVQALLEAKLAEKMGKKIDVMVRSAAELRSVLAANPFPHGKPAQIGALFLADRAPKDLMDRVNISGPEEVKPAGRVIYVHYPLGMGRSKLKFPATVVGTTLNLNTIAKLVEMTSTQQDPQEGLRLQRQELQGGHGRSSREGTGHPDPARRRIPWTISES
jgi:uncharacterized protein (DUF1697 family)